MKTFWMICWNKIACPDRGTCRGEKYLRYHPEQKKQRSCSHRWGWGTSLDEVVHCSCNPASGHQSRSHVRREFRAFHLKTQTWVAHHRKVIPNWVDKLQPEFHDSWRWWALLHKENRKVRREAGEESQERRKKLWIYQVACGVTGGHSLDNDHKLQGLRTKNSCKKINLRGHRRAERARDSSHKLS